MIGLPKLLFTSIGFWLSVIVPAWPKDPVPLGDENVPTETEAQAAAAARETPPISTDPMGGQAKEAPSPSEQKSTPAKAEGSEEDPEKKSLAPLTPDLANLNLAEDLELVTLDTKEKIFLPAGTYRQILRIPIDSPTMQSAQKTRLERRPEIKTSDPLPPIPGPEKKPLWIRFESLEKIKINEEERRGGLDVPINGPPDLKIRLWYAKSETADVASSVFYFVFGGLGYSTANILGWSAGNTREIPGDFEYRLIRK